MRENQHFIDIIEHVAYTPILEEQFWHTPQELLLHVAFLFIGTPAWIEGI